MKILATVTYSRQVEIETEIPDSLLSLPEPAIRKIQKDIIQAAGNGSEKMQITEVMVLDQLISTVRQDAIQACLIEGKAQQD
jgi:hypothetical protein